MIAGVPAHPLAESLMVRQQRRVVSATSEPGGLGLGVHVQQAALTSSPCSNRLTTNLLLAGSASWFCAPPSAKGT